MHPIASPRAVVSSSELAWKLLNGVICIYKPLGYNRKIVWRLLPLKLCEDLNQMNHPPRQEIVQIRRVEMNGNNEAVLENEQVVASFEDGRKKVEVVKGLGYADHPLVAGKRFLPKDIKMQGVGSFLSEVSGVHVIGINRGNTVAQRIFHSRWLKTYLVSGKFGIATETFFHTGLIMEKSTYKSITRHLFERLLAQITSAHQRLSFLSSGVPLDSEQAYELASQGLVRPAEPSASVIYSIKLVEFDSPNFTIEVKAVNEDPFYLKRLVHEIGLKLRSVAVCTKINCTNVGPFGVTDALLVKHWTLQHVIDNMQHLRNIMKKQNYELKERDLWVDKYDEVDEEEESSEEELQK